MSQQPLARPKRFAHAPSALLRLWCALVLALVGAVLVVPATAQAAGSISLDKTSSGNVLLGGEVEYHLAATNPSGSGVEQYNLSYVDVLPPGVTYVSGSTSPTGFGEPQVTTITDDATVVPPITHQVLVWSNVSDLTPGSIRTLTFSATVDPDEYPIGSTVDNSATAATSSDPREVPEFDDDGTLQPGDEVVSSTDSATTRVTAIRITKAEPSPESELIRGVNDHQTVYTLTVTNNDEGPTSGLVVTDYLPAGLEFLGCGGAFNSAAPEYPGASNTVAPVSGCDPPTSVDTVLNPAGYPAGVYTQVTWSIAAVTAGSSRTISYAAGIPQRANTMTWPGTAPTAASGRQAANLDNNTGASTRETASEPGLTNHATVSGSFQGDVVADSTSHTVTAEDLRMVKTVSPSSFEQGELATYTLSIDSSEYDNLSRLTITDTIPSGLCVIDDDTNPTGLSDCAARAGHGPTNASITGVTANADGSFDVVFTPDATALDHDGHLTITYQALMRDTYDVLRSSGPTSASDGFTNHAVISGTSSPRTDTNSPDSTPVEVHDESSATITAAGPQLTKLRMENATPMRCSADVGDYTAEVTGNEDAFAEGDRVCFLLEVQFPAGVDTRNAQLTDFLPSGVSYESATELTPGGLISSTSPALPTSYVTWNLGSGDPRTVRKGTLFQVVVSAIVTKPAPLTTTPKALAKNNLAKFRYTNTGGQSDSLRSSVTLPLGPPPPIGITKGVQSLNGAPIDTGSTPGNVDDVVVRGGDQVTYRVDLQNLSVAGQVNAEPLAAPDVWDVLAKGVTCADISATSDGGICYDAGATGRPSLSNGDTTSSVIRWQLPRTWALAPQQYGKLTYTVTVRPDVSVSITFLNTAAVASFVTETNVDDGSGPTLATHNPEDNISADVPSSAEDVPAASDTSARVRTPDAVVSKSGTTAITEANNSASQGVVGEKLTYKVSVVLPAGTTVYIGRLTESMPTGVVVDGPATAHFSPTGTSPATADLPDGVSLDEATGNLNFGLVYANRTATDQLFEVTIPARIGTDPTNTHGIVRTNTATFTSFAAVSGGVAITPRTATSNVTVVEPQPSITKTRIGSGAVTGGSTLTFNLAVSNASGRPPLAETLVVDCLPAPFTFAGFVSGFPTGAVAADPTEYGCVAGTTAIYWNLNKLAGTGTATNLRFTATVTGTPPAGSSYTNTGTVSGRSLGASDADPALTRTYSATSSLPISIVAATIAKTAAQSLTIGQRGTWTLTATLPANTVFYDSIFTDSMPAGFVISGITADSVTCSGFVTCPTVTPLASNPAVPTLGQATVIGWGVGDLPSSASVRTITLTYSATVADIASNTAGTGRSNTGFYKWNLTDKGNTPTSVTATMDQTATSAAIRTTIIEPALVMAKAVDDTTPEPGQVFTYTVTASNTGRGGANLSPAYNVTVVDAVPAGVVPQTINDGGSWDAGTRRITWTVPGPIAVGGSQKFTYTARLDASSTLTAAALTNTVNATRYESLATGGRTSYTATAATSTVTPQFPAVTPTKDVSTQVAYVGVPVTWTITLTNSGGADARNAKAIDTLPANWTYDAGSAQYSINGSDFAALADPAIVTSAGTQVLTWATGRTIPARSGTTNGTLKITFTARPTSLATTTPGVGTTVPHTNQATAEVQDGTAATANKTASYATGTGTASTYINAADLQLTKTSDHKAAAGGTLTWTIAVRNAGPNTAVNPITVVDTLPSQDAFSSFSYDNSANGWACSLVVRTLTCTRSASLAANTSAPDITVTAILKSSVAAGIVLTNSATVSSPTFDTNLANNSGSVDDTTTRSVDIQIVKKASTPTVVAGQNVTYTLDVKNNGLSDSASGTFTVTDNLPPALSYVSAAGAGWSCSESPAGSGMISCTTTAAPLANATLPTITVTAKVASGATAEIANTATVTGPEPGVDPNTGNNTSTAKVTPTTSADLALNKMHSTGTDDWIAGGTGSYTFTVLNYGPSDAAAPKVVDTLPSSLSFVSGPVSGPWSCSASGQTVTCTRSSSFAAGTTATPTSEQFAITVRVDAGLPSGSTIHNEATVSSTTPDPVTSNNTARDDTPNSARADLGITKSGPGSAAAGEVVPFTLVVHNYGESDSPAPVAGSIDPITVTDTLPTGMTLDSYSGTNWSCAASGQVVTCKLSTGLTHGTGAPTLTIRALVASGVAAGNLTNHASVTGPLNDPKPGNNSDQRDVTILVTPSLTITKTASPTTVLAGNDVTYTIVVRSTGPSDATNVELIDPLATGLTFVSVTGPSGWNCSTTAVDCTRARMAAGDSATFTVKATVGAGVPDRSSITNTAKVTGDGGLSKSDRATVQVATEANLTLTKKHDTTADPLPAGSDVTFTLTAKNNGPSDAQADVTLVDTLPVGLTYVSSGAGWTCTAGTANASGQVVTCILGAGILQAGVTATPLTMTAHIDAGLDPAASPLENSATVTSTTTPGDDGTASDKVPVTFFADLGITKDGPATANAGARITYALTVKNWGPSDSPAPGAGVDPIVVTDTLPDTLSFDAVSGGADWDCGHVGNAVTCRLQTGLAAGATAPVISVTATSDASLAATTTIDNTASVNGPLPEPSGASHPNSDSHEVTLTTLADLSIEKVATPTAVHAGEQVAYRITVTNNGPSDALDVQLSDPLAAGLTLDELDPPNSDWTCVAGGTVDCTTPRLQAGPANAVTFTVTATVASSVASGTSITNTATVTSPTDPTADSDDATVAVDSRADLSLTKSHAADRDPIQAGDDVTFTLVTTNNGPSDAEADIELVDTLPVGMTYVGNGPGWTCTPGTPDGSGQVVTCILDAGALAAMDSATLTLAGHVDAGLDPAVTSLENTATVTSTTTPGDDGHATDIVPIGYSADLSITKSHTASDVRIGDPLAFTLQVHNAGLSAARGVTVTDDLPAGLVYVSAAGTSSPSAWSCSYVAPTVTCEMADPLAVGDAEPIQVITTVLASAYPRVANPAEVEATTPDPDTSDNSTTDPVTVPPQVDLGITKSHTPEPMQVGDQATYTIGVSNAGNTDDPGALTVTDTLPAGLTFVSGGGDGWSCSAAGQDVTCVRAAGLATTANTSFSLVVQVGPEAYPGVLNSATVTSPAEDTNPDNNTANDPATVLPLYDLVVDKELARISSSRADWTITVTNNGPNEAPNGAVVTDPLPSALRYDGFTGDGWTCSAAGQLVTCTYDQVIAAGQVVGFTLHTAVRDGASGTIVNSATVDGGNTDSATATFPTDNDDLASTGGIAGGAGLLGLVLVGCGLLLVRARRSA